jgi:hypothetical protein
MLNIRPFKTKILAVALSFSAVGATAQEIDTISNEATAPHIEKDSLAKKIVEKPLPRRIFGTPVYTHYQFLDQDFNPFQNEYSGHSYTKWIDEANAVDNNSDRVLQNYIINNPSCVKYNIATLPEPPKEYVADVDPRDHTITIREVKLDAPQKMENDVKKKHWIKAFDASIQFSQAYVSPNWYQGGNNNLNMLASVKYNVKLNTVYHPNLLFESTFQYKLGMNSAPDDSLRNYSISEDLLQINSTFGIKAAKKWYYSITAQFKTQLLKSYGSNTWDLKSALLSPAELTAGLGMTYNHANKKKTFTFDASIAPLSYNLKLCTNSSIDHSLFSMDQDQTTLMSFGSSGECKLTWQMTKNISFTSRLFGFTDYGYIQADWENTLTMDINKFLKTQIYVHARYDSTTPRIEDEPNWHNLQVKEILSFGFTYSFKSV